MGANIRYRPLESVGLEVAAQRHADEERTHSTLAASGQLFAFPWSRVSPYVLGGVTYTDRKINDTIFLDGAVSTVTANSPLMGPHGGAGIEFAIGKKLALDLEARYIHYINPEQGDPTLPAAIKTNVGVLYHF